MQINDIIKSRPCVIDIGVNSSVRMSSRHGLPVTCTWNIKGKGVPLWGQTHSGLVCVSCAHCAINRFSCRTEDIWVSRHTLKELEDGKMDGNNKRIMFVSFSLYYTLSLSPLSLSHSRTVTLCLSFTHSLSLCNQRGLSYTPTALWLLPAGFRCLQSGCTFQQAHDCGSMKL